MLFPREYPECVKFIFRGSLSVLVFPDSFVSGYPADNKRFFCFREEYILRRIKRQPEKTPKRGVRVISGLPFSILRNQISGIETVIILNILTGV